MREHQHWFCADTSAHREKQIENAIRLKEPKPDASPYFFVPLPFQVDVKHHPADRLMVHGAQGVSKSYFGRMYAYDRCMSIPGFRVLLLRRTYDELNKNHLTFMPDEAEILGAKWHSSGINAKQMWFSHGPNDPKSIIFAGSCQDEGDIKAHVGPEYDLVLLEEGVMLMTKAIREIMARDRGSATARMYLEGIGLVGQTRILTNPGGVAMNYLKRLFIEKNAEHEDFPDYDPSYFGHMAGEIRDNPYLREDFVAKSLGHLDPIRSKQLAEGRWDVFEGQFFSDFSPALHVVAMEPQ